MKMISSLTVLSLLSLAALAAQSACTPPPPPSIGGREAEAAGSSESPRHEMDGDGPMAARDFNRPDSRDEKEQDVSGSVRSAEQPAQLPRPAAGIAPTLSPNKKKQAKSGTPDAPAGETTRNHG